ncbi:MAG: hypothetical protein MAG431_01008 [Chloroflexi bacterium]|nr:hypothetical protein [Chloroflexota bacterium]
MSQRYSSKTFPMAIGLLNLSGLGLGYLYLKRWVRLCSYPQSRL